MQQVLGQCLELEKQKHQLQDRPEGCSALRFVHLCRLPEQWWEVENAAGFGEGGCIGFGSSEGFASLQANVPGKPIPRQVELLFYLV